MGEIMNSPKGVKSDVPERVSISCPICGTRHALPKTTGSPQCVTIGEQTIQHMWYRSFKFVNKVCMMTIEYKGTLMGRRCSYLTAGGPCYDQNSSIILQISKHRSLFCISTLSS